uniref:Uncharacterized protein n=1 Tax=Amphora coffeiformis TaxID=265554 RepID=A0A7S3L0E9_9STRA
MVALATAGSNDIAIAPFFQYETSVATSSSPAVPATAMNETATKEAAIVPFSNAEPVLQGVQAAVPATNGTANVPFFFNTEPVLQRIHTALASMGVVIFMVVCLLLWASNAL